MTKDQNIRVNKSRQMVCEYSTWRTKILNSSVSALVIDEQILIVSIAWLPFYIAILAIRAAKSDLTVVIVYVEKNMIYIYKQLKRQTTSTIDASCVVPAPFI